MMFNIFFCFWHECALQLHVPVAQTHARPEPSAVLPDGDDGRESVLSRQPIETQRDDVELVIRRGRVDAGRRVDIRLDQHGHDGTMGAFQFELHEKNPENKHGNIIENRSIVEQTNKRFFLRARKKNI